MWEGVLLSQRFERLGVESFSHLMLVYMLFWAICGLVKKILGQSREMEERGLTYLMDQKKYRGPT